LKRNILPVGFKKSGIFSCGKMSSTNKIILFCVKRTPENRKKNNVKSLMRSDPFRPDTKYLNCEQYIILTMKECWDEIPDNRPDFRSISKKKMSSTNKIILFCVKRTPENRKTYIFTPILASI
jgi:hypothetical protein